MHPIESKEAIKETHKKSRDYGLTALVAVGVLFVAMIFMFGFLVNSSLRSYQADETSQHERNELHRKLDVLEQVLADDHAAYKNRGIIQKSMMNRLIQKGYFSPAEIDLLRAVASQANYPSEDGK